MLLFKAEYHVPSLDHQLLPAHFRLHLKGQQITHSVDRGLYISRESESERRTMTQIDVGHPFFIFYIAHIIDPFLLYCLTTNAFFGIGVMVIWEILEYAIFSILEIILFCFTSTR